MALLLNHCVLLPGLVHLLGRVCKFAFKALWCSDVEEEYCWWWARQLFVWLRVLFWRRQHANLWVWYLGRDTANAFTYRKSLLREGSYCMLHYHHVRDAQPQRTRRVRHGTVFFIKVDNSWNRCPMRGFEERWSGSTCRRSAPRFTRMLMYTKSSTFVYVCNSLVYQTHISVSVGVRNLLSGVC